jgi:hypothetical protein
MQNKPSENHVSDGVIAGAANAHTLPGTAEIAIGNQNISANGRIFRRAAHGADRYAVIARIKEGVRHCHAVAAVNVKAVIVDHSVIA